ncbi:MAG: hypothetical protein V1726_00880, partial [Methanobacteriota archaeon]
IARDMNESVNVTDHLITQADINSGHITLDLIVNIHYRDLTDFPWYQSTVDTGAASMKMMLDYLMWNRTINPQGPPSVYSEQTLFNTYKGTDNTINATELCAGLNTEIDDYHQGWIYGYFFAPHGYDSITDALRTICTWVDYPVNFYNNNREIPVPKPGHPNHVPVAIPFSGTFAHWVSVRGVHTNHDAWYYTGPLTIYGFWVNDPASGGIGSNTYVTVDKMISDYYLRLNALGNQYHNKFVTITDPPNINAEIPTPDVTTEVTYAHSPAGFTLKESLQIQRAQLSTLSKRVADTTVINAAYDGAEQVLRYSEFSDEFAQTHVLNKPVYNKGECAVGFSDGITKFIVTIGLKQGELRQIQVQNV